ncbi:glycosyl hydrolase family 28-related protein [Paenibacillus cymbidii]|uniref:glycosyl hydrolase family 28-related protein n=1 Tax=Paenibacillus cymbidii TaxID=1639034 RepID=UPI001436838A|nr:glycosyl hydrolase family 28-related protein [Paenibacillus cymbidii]
MRTTIHRTLVFGLALLLALGALPRLAPTASATGPWYSSLYPADWYPGYTDAQGRFLQDFSYAGYHRGEDPIPDNPPGKTYDVTQAPYNADNTGATDATSAIQAALDDAGDAGGGVVFLPAGTYKVKPQGTNDYALLIDKSNVVLRGVGADDTLLYNDETNMHNRSVVLARPEAYTTYVKWWTETPGEEIDTTLLTQDVPEMSTVIPVSSVSSYSVGDWVVLHADVTQDFIDELAMTDYWNPYFEEMTFYRQVTAIDTVNKTLTIDIPTRFKIKTRDNARVYKSVNASIKEVGVERLGIGMRENLTSGTADGDYAVPGTGGYEMHLAHAISYDMVVNGWVRHVQAYKPAGNTHKDIKLLSSGVNVQYSRNVTVDHCYFGKPEYEGAGGNGYMFRIVRSQEVLVSHSSAKDGRHNYAIVGMSASGNVLYDNKTDTARLSTETHGWMSAANLFDNMRVINTFMTATNHHDSGRSANGQGQTTTQTVFWNTLGDSYQSGQSYIIKSQQYGWGYIIGTRGAANAVQAVTTDDGTAPIDFVEGEGEGDTMAVPSLYMDQLSKRLSAPRVNYAETFDGMTTGSAPTGLNAIVDGGTVTVANVPSATNKSVKLTDSSASEGVKVSKNFAPIATTVKLQFNVMFNSTGHLNYYKLMSGSTAAVFLRTTGTSIQALDSGGTYTTLRSFNANTWYTIKLVANPATDKYDVYINNKLEGSQLGFANAVSDIDSFAAQSHSSDSGYTSYLDDLTLYAESFDSAATSSAPPGWTTDTGGGTVQVKAVPSGTNKSIELRDTNSSDIVKAYKTFPSQTGTVTAEFKLMFPATGSSNYVTLYDGSTEAVRFRTIGSDMQYMYSGTETTLQSYSPNTWYTIKLVANPATDKCDVYIDGVLVGSQLNFRNAASGLDRFDFRSHSTHANYYGYLDDVLIHY